jgi:hypothetical protein
MKLALRVEWAKSLARKLRWTEEVQILKEEMRRVIAYSKWRATWWEDRIHARPGLTLDLQEGLRAYAVRQSSIHQGRGTLLEKRWAIPEGNATNILSTIPDWVDTNADNSDSGDDEY